MTNHHHRRPAARHAPAGPSRAFRGPGRDLMLSVVGDRDLASGRGPRPRPRAKRDDDLNATVTDRTACRMACADALYRCGHGDAAIIQASREWQLQRDRASSGRGLRVALALLAMLAGCHRTTEALRVLAQAAPLFPARPGPEYDAIVERALRLIAARSDQHALSHRATNQPSAGATRPCQPPARTEVDWRELFTFAL